ncbi:hypothetical protein STEG23_020596 [Scotinomys teguina]
MTAMPLGWDQDCSLKNREPDGPASWFLDPGGWSKATAVGLYFIFPGICTLSLDELRTTYVFLFFVNIHAVMYIYQTCSINQLFEFIDRVVSLSCLVFREDTQTYKSYSREWIKERISLLLNQQTQPAET